jgi:hypothetical protein
LTLAGRPELCSRGGHAGEAPNETQAFCRNVAVRRNSDRRAGTAKRPRCAEAIDGRVQKLVKSIGADPAKVKIYCDVRKLQDQMDQAEQKKDTKTVAALGAQADNLGKQLGPDYERVVPAWNRSIRIPRKENAMARCFSRCSNSANSAANLK